MEILETFKDNIEKLCKKYKVNTLYSVDSVKKNESCKDTDILLMVDFVINDPFEYTDNYFDLKFEMERFLNRSVEIIESRAIKNPLRRETIDKFKIPIYVKS